MNETKFTIDTIKKAIAILATYAVATEPQSIKNIKVGNVSYLNGQTGEPFVWENSGQPYAIVNLRITAPDMYAKAIEILQDPMFADVATDEVLEDDELLEALREVCNTNLSFNANIDLAKELEAVGRVNVDIEEVDLQEEGETGLRVAGCRPVVLQVAKRNSADALLALLNRTEVPVE